MRNFAFSFLTWIKSLKIQLQEKSPGFEDGNWNGPNTRDKVFKDAISYFSDVFTAVVIIVVIVVIVESSLGSLSNYDDDDNLKKQ